MVRYAAAPVAAPARPGRATAPARCAALRRQATALALAEMVGGMQAALDMTVAYVKEREQFGQKIAVFQAVQHQVADMATAFTAARHLAWQAITRMAAGSEEGMELMHACAFVPQAFKRVTWARASSARRRRLRRRAPAALPQRARPGAVHPLRAGGRRAGDHRQRPARLTRLRRR